MIRPGVLCCLAILGLLLSGTASFAQEKGDLQNQEFFYAGQAITIILARLLSPDLGLVHTRERPRPDMALVHHRRRHLEASPWPPIWQKQSKLETTTCRA